MSLLDSPCWFVGCGNMAGAMVEGWREGGVDLSQAVAIRPSATPVPGLRTVASLAEAGPPPRLVVLGFKPQQIDEVAPTLQPWLTSRTVIVSILAGVEAASLRARFAKPRAIVRAMPNLPVSVRRGVTALFSEDADEDLRDGMRRLFSVLGYAAWTDSEAEFSAIGAVAGSGPAYVARFVDALAEVGRARGLAEPIARTIAIETLFGTGWMAAASGEEMAAIARRVASPGGTTEAGLKILDGENGLSDLIGRMVEASTRRGAEMAAQARR